MGLLIKPHTSIIRDGAIINEGLAHTYDYIDVDFMYMKAPSGLLPSNEQLISSSNSSFSSPSSSSIHSHSPLSTHATTISTHSSLNSLPSLTLSCNSPFSSSYNGGDHHPECEYHCVATLFLDAHVSSLVSAGDYVYGGSSSSNTIHVWLKNDLHKGKIPQYDACKGEKLGYGDGAVRALATVGLDRVVSAHDHDNKIRVWKTSSLSQCAAAPHVGPVNHTFKLLTTMPTLTDYLKNFLLPNNYVQVRRHHKRLWIEHMDAISALAVLKDGEFLYSASWDRSIKVWRLSDFKCVESVRMAHDDAINCLVLSQDGNFIYTGSADTKVKVWAVLSQEAKRVQGQRYHDVHRANSKSIRLVHSAVSILEGHKSAVNALALSPDGRLLYSGAGDKAIIVWEREETSTEHMVRAGVLRGHRNAILCLATIAGGGQEEAHMLCSGSADKTIRIWKGERRRCMKGAEYEYSCVRVLEGHMGPVRCMSVSVEVSHDDDNDDSRVHYLLYSASLDTTLKIWRLPIH